MAYQSGDDPQLLSDLRIVLRRWHRSTLGDTALASGLEDVERRLAADPWLTRSKALQDTVLAALASLWEDSVGTEQADLLERHYLRGESGILLTETFHLSERSIYHRLREARVPLSHALWDLERPDVEGGPGSFPVSTPSRTRHLLPPTYSHLFGMDERLAQLLDYLNDYDHHWVISLDGMAGLGKTALAREAVGRLAKTDRFADIAWVSVSPVAYTLHGPEHLDLPALTCGQVLDAIAHQLGAIDLSPLPLPTKRDRVRDLLHACPCLVVLDNLETVRDCDSLPNWFWEMADPSKFLLTSRHWLQARLGPSVLILDQLSEQESLALLRHEAHLRGLPEVVEAGDETLSPILTVTGGNPLAIKLVVGQLVSLPLSRILAALETAQPGAESFYQYLYRVSWELLSAPAKLLLMRMVKLPSSGGPWQDLSAVSGLSAEDLASAIEDLTTHSLLQAVGFEKTYSLHPLTRHFAASQVAREAETEKPMA